MKKRLALWLLRALGWRVGGTQPNLDRYVLIAAPHTSNWDFPLMLAFAAVYDMRISWMGKHSLFKPPWGFFMRALGGVPIKRDRNHNVVEAMVETFNQSKKLVLVVPTEGTRKRVDYWKSGFYHIAHQANVPIVPSFLDWGSKCGGFGPALIPTGDVVADMQYFRDFYAGMRGKFHDQFGPIVLREEAEQTSEAMKRTGTGP